jgi:hypothetical protein
MHVFEPTSYGPVFARLLDVDRNRPLHTGTADPSDASRLKDLSVRSAFGHARLADATMANACLAAVWLLHDFLDRSHTISQGLKTREGSFWHGIMHRREGDYQNAKYWFRNVEEHPVFGDLATFARQVAADHGENVAREILGWTDWDPCCFVDLCQIAAEEGDGESLFRTIQQAEWELLFDYCYRRAVG